MNPAELQAWTEGMLIALARVGALVMLLPALGERTLPARQRLALALTLCLIVVPQVRLAVQAAPGQVLQRMISEVLIGLALGTCGRLVIAAMETAGSLIAQNVGLSFAQAVDPGMGGQGEVLATFLRMSGVALIFASDLHHVLIAGIVGSYVHLPVGSTLPTGDLAELLLRVLSASFATGVAIAAPFIVFGFVFNMGLGLAARLTPQLQLFFIAMPVSVVLGVAGLALAMPGAGERFLAFAQASFTQLLPGP